MIGRRRASQPRVLIIVQNLPVPFDRRVWLESLALTAAGYRVVVVCPKGDGDPSYQELDGVEVHKYTPYAPGGSALGFVLEYAYSFLATARLVLRARLAGGRFQVMQACNPPDIFWPIALVLRLLDRTRFVFDHHDLCPELYESRFSAGSSPAHRGLLALEGATVRTADHIISTNDSYAALVKQRHGKPSGDVTVVRTGPDLSRLRRVPEDVSLRGDHRYLAAYIGVMGPQDGVDIVLRAADVVINRLGCDVRFLLMGAGDCWADLVALRDELGLQDHVVLPGRVPDEFVLRALSTADVGLSPDPKNPLNDLSTMNKTMEYMAFGLPVVAFDLRETRVSAQGAATYVQPNSVEEYAKALVALLGDEHARSVMGGFGRTRVHDELAWPHQERAYVEVYDRLLDVRRPEGRRVIDLTDSALRRRVGA